jgi:hypothetical protein
MDTEQLLPSQVLISAMIAINQVFRSEALGNFTDANI